MDTVQALRFEDSQHTHFGMRGEVTFLQLLEQVLIPSIWHVTGSDELQSVVSFLLPATPMGEVQANWLHQSGSIHDEELCYTTTISKIEQNYSSYLHWQWSLVDAAQSDIGYVGDRDHHVSQRGRCLLVVTHCLRPTGPLLFSFVKLSLNALMAMPPPLPKAD